MTSVSITGYAVGVAGKRAAQSRISQRCHHHYQHGPWNITNFSSHSFHHGQHLCCKGKWATLPGFHPLPFHLQGSYDNWTHYTAWPLTATKRSALFACFWLFPRPRVHDPDSPNSVLSSLTNHNTRSTCCLATTSCRFTLCTRRIFERGTSFISANFEYFQRQHGSEFTQISDPFGSLPINCGLFGSFFFFFFFFRVCSMNIFELRVYEP